MTVSTYFLMNVLFLLFHFFIKMTTQLISQTLILTISVNFLFALYQAVESRSISTATSFLTSPKSCCCLLQASLLFRPSLHPTLNTGKSCFLTCQPFPLFHANAAHLSIWSCQVTPSLKPSISITSNLSFLSSPSKL